MKLSQREAMLLRGFIDAMPRAGQRRRQMWQLGEAIYGTDAWRQLYDADRAAKAEGREWAEV